jgi:hypothetical protein
MFGKRWRIRIAVVGRDLEGAVDLARSASGSMNPRRRTADVPTWSRCRKSRANEIFADSQADAVVGDYVELLDVVVGFAGHDGVDAAGVVADHAADGAAVVAGGIGSEGEVMLFGGVAESVEDDSGLHAGDAAGGIDLENARHVLGKIEDDGDVAALAGERSAAAAAEERRAEFAAEEMVARTSSLHRGEGRRRWGPGGSWSRRWRRGRGRRGRSGRRLESAPRAGLEYWRGGRGTAVDVSDSAHWTSSCGSNGL